MSRSAFVLALALSGCTIGKAGHDATSLEGDDAGECSDGADNNTNGYFDCDDQGCWNSPDCSGETGNNGGDDTDTNNGGDTDTDTNSGPAVADFLQNMTLTMSLHFDFDDALCDAYGICDCTNHYSGDGDQISASGNMATMTGKWQLDSSDCNSSLGLNDAIWVPSSKTAYHTFKTNADGTVIDDWLAHRDETATDPYPVDQAADNGQFYVLSMGQTWNAATKHLDYEETESDVSSGTTIVTTTTLAVDFNQ